MSVYPMDNVVQPYDWGSTKSIAALQGRETAAEPEAEMWMGSHPKAPSYLPSVGKSLLELIEAAPDTIGSRAQALNPPGGSSSQLPYLFKILAAEKGLSIQAHPDRTQAAGGFDREEAAGIDRSAPDRNYRDRNHKPELICAIEPYRGLCGFREFEEIAAEFRGLYDYVRRADDSVDTLEIAELTRLFYEEPIPDNLRMWFVRVSDLLVQAESAGRDAFAGALEMYARTKWIETESGGRDRLANRYWWTLELLRQFPGDPGAAATLYLNLFSLEPGEAVFLGPRILHAYLRGTGVEIMANSDNVLRAGCTVKHVDPTELAGVLDFSGGSYQRVDPESDGVLTVYPTPAPEFELVSLALAEDAPVAVKIADAPAIALTIGGTATVHGESGESALLQPGQSLFLDANEGSATVSGSGTLFVASLPGAVRRIS